jgi:hypothetical protein
MARVGADSSSSRCLQSPCPSSRSFWRTWFSQGGYARSVPATHQAQGVRAAKHAAPGCLAAPENRLFLTASIRRGRLCGAARTELGDRLAKTLSFRRRDFCGAQPPPKPPIHSIARRPQRAARFRESTARIQSRVPDSRRTRTCLARRSSTGSLRSNPRPLGS